ncbi:MAG: hypothetical protein AAB263_21240 [Planctomycetota bacterium]
MTTRLLDRSATSPRFEIGINAGNLDRLPTHSSVPRNGSEVDLAQVKAAGFSAYQGDVAAARSHNWPAYAGGRVNATGEIGKLATAWKDGGYLAATLHVGWGHEDDATADAIIGDILETEARVGLPLFVETHRATLTQDTWRTVQLVKRHPDLRFNADFSHWYTGLEMVYGDFNAKLDFLQPVFDRVKFFHGRIGHSGAMQAPWDDPGMARSIPHFQEMWTRAMAGFRRHAAPGEILPFMCELLGEHINYQPRLPIGDGGWIEGGDRWAEALKMADFARTCWSASATMQ